MSMHEPAVQSKTNNVSESDSEKTGDSKVIDKDKIGNIYWVGADLALLFDAVLRNENRGQLTERFKQANHHLKILGIEKERTERRSEAAH